MEKTDQTAPVIPSVNPQGGSSACGHSFVNAFQDCPRKWLLRYELGITPRYTGKALTFGLAWHKAIEGFYGSSGEEALALAQGLEILHSAQANHQYEYSEDYDADTERFPVMLSEWFRSVGRDILGRFDVLSLEETLSIELPNGFVFTGRLDELLQERTTGLVFVAEHKSTAYSLTEMERNVFVGDQVPGYLALLRENKPEYSAQLGGCLLDVTYQKGRSLQARVSRLAYDESDTARLVLNITGVLNELSQKISAYRSGVSDALLFPRNGSACSRFRCPYESICRSFIDADSTLPDKLVRVPLGGFVLEEELGA